MPLGRRCGNGQGGNLSSLAGNYVVNERLVKIVDTAEGGIDILAFDEQRHAFVRNPRYLSIIMRGQDEIRRVSDDEFERLLETE